MATIPTIQLFRNSIIKTGRQAAIDALDTQKAFVPDGGLILARYSSDGKDSNVKTLLGIVRNSGGANAELTVIDVEGAAENVQSAITSAINGLNKADNAVDGQYVASVSEDKGIITVTRQELPSFDEKSDSGKAITAITQTKGLVSVKFGGVAAANVSVADEGNKFTATNVEDTLLEIKTSLDNAIGTGGSVAEQITNAINDLDSSATSENNYFDVTVAQKDGKITGITVTNKDIASAALLGKKEDASTAETAFGRIAKEVAERTAAIEAMSLVPVSGTGKVITAITQTNGVVNATADTLSADNVSASEISSSDATVAVTGTNVSAQIASLATSIKSVESGKTYTISAVTSSEANVKEAFALVDGSGTQAGATIKIYKDSSLKSVALNGQMLNFTYILADGSESTVGVDVSTFLAESEFKDGLEVVDGIVKVKKDASSEKFLSVSESGVKLDGVQAAINTAAAAATTKVKLGDGTDKITLTPSTAADGSVTYTIGQNDIASAALLGTKNDASTAETAFGYIAKEVAARTAAIGDLNLTQVGGEGKVITTISQSSGKVSVTAATLGAENVSASTITDDGTKVAVTGDNVKAQIESLATSIKSASTAAAAAHTKVEAKTDGHVIVSVAKSKDGSHDVVTITENDIASASALETETNARVAQDDKIEAAVGLNADGNHVKTNGHYTKDATTVVGEIEALDTKLKEVSDTLGTGVSTVATVTAQLQALSGSSTSDTSDTISVIGAKKYTDAQIANLNATITGTSDHVDVTVAQANGKITSVTVANKDIASASDLDDETTARTNADTELSNRLGTAVTTAATATAQLQALSGTTGDASGVTSVNGAKAYAKDLVDNLKADVESTTESTTETTTTKAIRIKQTNGKIASITLGAFDCGVY